MSLAWVDPQGEDYRAHLMAAGYVLDEPLELWLNRALDRAIDAGIASRLTLAQIDEWIAAGY